MANDVANESIEDLDDELDELEELEDEKLTMDTPIAEDDDLFGLTDGDVDKEDDDEEEDDAAIALPGADPDDPFEALEADAKADAGKPPAAVAQPRDLAGKYAAKTEADATAAAAVATDAAAAAAAAAPAAPTPQKWETLKVRVDKAEVPIDEAQVTRFTNAEGQGFHSVWIKDADYPRFAARMGRAHQYETTRQQIDAFREKLAAGVKELEDQASAPPVKTDAEIEAQMMLDAMKPYLDESMSEVEQDLLAARIEIAQNKNRASSVTSRETHIKTRRDADTAAATAAEAERAAEAQPALDEETSFRGLANEIFHLVDTRPELAGMTVDEKKAAYTALGPAIRAAYYKHTDGKWYADHNLIVSTLLSKKGAASAAAPAATVANTATPAAATTRAERLNRGHDSAVIGTPKKPTSTSLTAGRTTDPRSRNTSETPPARRKGPVKTPDMIAEDSVRAAHKRFMASDTLDFDDDDEDGV